ncbi:MAG: MXAN_5808 family serine peptidase [Polyangia bacterium]
MRRKSTTAWGLALAIAVLGGAVWLTFFTERHGGLDLEADAQGSSAERNAAGEIPDSTTYRALYRTINLVQKSYIDPARIDSRRMLIEGMRAVEKQVAEVLLRLEGDRLVVRLGSEKRSFDLADVETPWILLQRAREVLDFVRSGISERDIDFQDVEYGAINGMLQILDPHTALLTPDVYRDMKDKTQGEFGGLGIVISIRDGALTIISPIDGTPADVAGLQAGDRIVKIGEFSTVSMSLNDAVNLLRGEPGTTVGVHILRKEWDEPREFEIVRDIIEVESVESHRLERGIGYVRVKDFQGNTAENLREQLDEMERDGIRGLVLDLRNNPGGLLAAAIEVADLFLEKGVIVTTAGQGPAQRDVSRASDGDDEPSYPLVVLINSGSASASEIVAGALQNHRRGLLVGQRTFGKGSVQVLYDYRDGSALKLTAAQYLTPGDVSIQSVGVVPDVGLYPVRADEKVLDLKIDLGYREIDLEGHFEERSSAAGKGGVPDETLRYLWTPPEESERRANRRDAGLPPREEERDFEPDWEVRLARDLAVELSDDGEREVDVSRLKPVLERRAAREEDKITAALRKLGVDWRIGPDDSSAELEVGLSLSDGGGLVAGQEGALAVRVRNDGPGTLYRMHATTRSDMRALDDRELAFGRIEPGETVERTLDFKIPKGELSRVDDVLVSFEEPRGRAPEPAALRFEVEALPEPRFAYGVQMVDAEGGNGDGRLQVGERVELLVDIENAGQGASLDTYATLRSLSGKKVFLIRGREELEELPPGERRLASFEFEVKPGFSEESARFELAVMDVELKVYTAEKLELPIAAPLETRPVSAVVAARERPVVVREYPADSAPAIGELKDGLAVAATARTDSHYRIEIGEGRPGWVSASAVEPSSQEPVAEPVEPAINSSPSLELDPVPRVVSGASVEISGRAKDESRVRDIYIFVKDDKVYFQHNPADGTPAAIRFSTEVPLEPGFNLVTVVAEETADLDTREVIAVRRDREDGMPYLGSQKPSGDPAPLGVRPARADSQPR